jgi:hypothetical protein
MGSTELEILLCYEMKGVAMKIFIGVIFGSDIVYFSGVFEFAVFR